MFFSGDPSEKILKFRFAGTHDCKLDDHRIDNASDSFREDVEPFLVSETADNADYRNIFVLIKSKTFLQFALAGSFSFETAGREVFGNVFIGFRIPD